MPPSPQATLKWFALSDQGRRRTNNEDSCGVFALDAVLAPLAAAPAAWPKHGALLIVSDGMGGARAGEVASRFCVDHLAAELHARRAAPDRKEAMAEAFTAVHQALTKFADADPARNGMGATLSAVWFGADGEHVLGHVGDSRVYLRRGETWTQVTEDHSVGAGMVRRGELTPEAATRMRFRTLLEQVMGGDGTPVQPQVVAGRQAAGDTWLMCSDGLYGPLGEDLLAVTGPALREPDLAASATALVTAANEAGGPDNITVVLARFVPKIPA
jgi:serine/threonine protein phosphatase PrpC